MDVSKIIAKQIKAKLPTIQDIPENMKEKFSENPERLLMMRRMVRDDFKNLYLDKLNELLRDLFGKLSRKEDTSGVLEEMKKVKAIIKEIESIDVSI